MFVVQQVVRIDCYVSRHARCVLVIKQSWREDLCYIIRNDEENVKNSRVIHQSTDTVKDARLGTSVASQDLFSVWGHKEMIHREQCVLKCVYAKKTCVQCNIFHWKYLDQITKTF